MCPLMVPMQYQKKLGEPTAPILVQNACGAEFATHSNTYVCPGDGYCMIGAGGRVMDGLYVPKNGQSQQVVKANTGSTEMLAYSCIIKCTKGDTIVSSVSGHGGNGCMSKSIFFVEF